MEQLPLFKAAKPQTANKNWGMFGYRGYSLDLAVEMDDPDAMREAHTREWIDKDTQTTFGYTLRRHCENRGKMKASGALAELGYPL